MLSTAQRFRSTIADYVAHRPRYPDALISAVARVTRIDRTSRILDLGTGPGFLAIAFAAHSDHVLGLDPSPDMLAAAHDAGAGTTVRFEEGSSLTLDSLEPGLALITMGRSFHWMDRDATLRSLDRLVRPDGAVALFNVTPPERPPQPWREAYEQFLADWERGLAPDPERASTRKAEPHTAVLDRSAFSQRVQLTVPVEARLTQADLVGRARSRSGTSPERLGDQADRFATELTAVLAPFAGPDGRIAERSRATAILAFRPGAL